MKDVDITIISVCYRSEKTILPLLDSIKKSPDKLQKQVIIIENDPDGKSAIVAQKHSLKPQIIKNGENIGFSKAVNQGLKQAKGKYILLLNADAKVVGDALNKLYQFAEDHPGLGAVAPRLLNSNGSIQASCSTFPTIYNAIKHDFFGNKKSFKKYIPKNKVEKVEVAVMAAFFLPKIVYEHVGGLDERFFLYYEDIEYCRRLRSYGYPIYYIQSSKVKHIHGASGKFTYHLKSPLLESAQIYYGKTYSFLLNSILWIGHKWQVILRGKRFRD